MKLLKSDHFTPLKIILKQALKVFIMHPLVSQKLNIIMDTPRLNFNLVMMRSNIYELEQIVEQIVIMEAHLSLF